MRERHRAGASADRRWIGAGAIAVVAKIAATSGFPYDCRGSDQTGAFRGRCIATSVGNFFCEVRFRHRGDEELQRFDRQVRLLAGTMKLRP